MQSGSSYTVHLLPPALRKGSAPEWGVQRGGQWVRWPPDSDVARFASEARAEAYAGQRNNPTLAAVAAGKRAAALAKQLAHLRP